MSSATVVGAGVFGAATARELGRRGWDVTLVEQYTPGNVRSGSGGDTRLLRFAHGDQVWYTLSALRSLELWHELEAETGLRLFEPVGVAWFDTGYSDFMVKSTQTLDRLGVHYGRITPGEARHFHFPSLGGDEVHTVVIEHGAGVLHARTATRALAATVRLEAGRPTPADPPRADVVIWACGSWLGKLFPDLVRLRISRRDVFFFGVDSSWERTPAFCEYEGPYGAYYGHGDLTGLGMKIAPDGPGEEIDPDTEERLPDPGMEARARAYAARRFPALADAPIVGTRVCQYDLTPDAHFLVARHPEHESWWLVGGGSGHGFKHGPALAEYVADCVEGQREPELFHGLGPRDAVPTSLRTATFEW